MTIQIDADTFELKFPREEFVQKIENRLENSSVEFLIAIEERADDLKQAKETFKLDDKGLANRILLVCMETYEFKEFFTGIFSWTLTGVHGGFFTSEVMYDALKENIMHINEKYGDKP